MPGANARNSRFSRLSAVMGQLVSASRRSPATDGTAPARQVHTVSPASGNAHVQWRTDRSVHRHGLRLAHCRCRRRSLAGALQASDNPRPMPTTYSCCPRPANPMQSAASTAAPAEPVTTSLDVAMERLSANKAAWAAAPVSERIAVLKEIRARLLDEVNGASCCGCCMC